MFVIIGGVIGFKKGTAIQSERAIRLQREMWEGKCPQCWASCEAYQTVLGHLPMLRRGKETDWSTAGVNEQSEA